MVPAKTTEWRSLIGVSAAALLLIAACSTDEGGKSGDQTTAGTGGGFSTGRPGTVIPGGIPPVAQPPAGAGSGGLGAFVPGLAGRAGSVPGGIPGGIPPQGAPGIPGGAAGAPAAPGGAPGAPGTTPPAGPPAAPPPAAAPGAPPFAMATGPEPTLPAIVGDCPVFMNGTVMVAGHMSIVLQVGEANKGGAVLFYWHGTGSSAQEGLSYNGNAEVVASGGIVAAFNGNESSGRGGDCSGTGAHNQADFEAADQIAACGKMMHGTDSRRIYTTGCSAGGLQSGCMAQMRSSYLAAAAPNSGGLVFQQSWEDDHTPAIFTMHGGSNDVVVVTFSQTSATLDQAAKSHGGVVVNCDHGGGHCMAPADLQKAGWQFMKDHPWGVTPDPWAGGIPAGVPDYCKIF